MALNAPTAFWEMEEASGTADRLDATNNNLDFSVLGNNVTQVAGKQGYAAKLYDPDRTYLARNDDTLLEFGGDFSIIFWLKWDVLPGPSTSGGIVSKEFPREIQFSASTYGGAGELKLAGTGSETIIWPSPDTSTWYLIALRRDVSAGQMSASFNNGTPTTQTWDVQSSHSTGLLRVQGDNVLDITVDQFGLWCGYYVTDAELTWLYNSGSGRTYAEVAAYGAGEVTLKLGDRVLTNGLQALTDEADKIYICSAEPTDYASVLSNALGVKSFTRGQVFGAPAAGSPSGRKVTSVAVTDGQVDTAGTPTCWAVVDSTSTGTFLASGPATGFSALIATDLWTLGAFPVHFTGAES